MIERLVQTLRTLAAPAARIDAPAELASEFADALLLVSDCPQVRLTPAQRDALEDLDQSLGDMTGPESGSRDAASVRAAAGRALASLQFPA